ncbi:MAG: tRNA pseudouridine(55) synthase TruB [bacterium]|nr:tRNA pseudouridine(55) synthase TruB [bacterium]
MNGALLINKEAGMTSFDVIRRLKSGLPRNTKLGHSGTLDPFATGVLIVLLGNATRLQDELHLLPKTYRATLTLGATSDTDDSTGVIRPGKRLVLTAKHQALRRPEILAALNQIKAQTSQIPPDYAAIKIQGQKMYDLARAGKTVLKKPRPITIHEITLESYEYPNLTISVKCSTGTYIRSIARDIGGTLGTGAYCSALARTAIGLFSIENSYFIKDLPKDLFSAIIPLEQLVQHIKSIPFSKDNVAKLKNGREVECKENAPINTPIALMDEHKKLFGIGMRENSEKTIKAKKIFLS